ncbi:MAG TPA: ComEC/Rec2 family competence protein [Xanthobacteraceae bacterium]|nr:ComEC/Rec2 family competence protein [Xanthobacteraceae bacterium]
MADDGGARSRARTGTRTWPVGGARGAWSPPWPRTEFVLPARLREWAITEVGAGRLLPWFAVAFGTGIVLYFTADREPAVWAASALAAAGAITAIAMRRRPVAFVCALGFFAIAAGFAVATMKTALIDHPVLRYPATNVSIAGFVTLREESQKTDRFVLRVERIDGNRIIDKPQRVRLSVRRGTAPPAGAFVEVKAQLEQPLRPGSYDFARDLFFQRIGASGFVRGAVQVITPLAEPGLWLRLDAFVQDLRDAIDSRIRSVLSGDVGSIASALITGKRDAITPQVYDAMFVSGIGHVLSISGYHMAVVAGVVFFVLRALLALVPGLADRAPIKKWAAFAALLVTAFYLVLSGAEVATQRSFIMIAIVLIGVLLDRPILTLRTVTIAALLVLFFAPEAVVHPSFQMSFAATLALVAGYERGMPWARAGADTSLGARAALWGVRETISLILASLLAGLATTPYAAYHFHRLAPYGVLANLLAMPIVSGWVMPMGILGVIAIPFGFDGIFWRQMGYGIEWMDAVALWVASLPGAFGRVTSFGTGPLLLGTAGLLVIGLLKTPLRWCGVVLAIVAIIWAARTPVPDILVAADGRTFAVRGADGRLALHHGGGDTFAMREWLAADADGRDVHDPGLGNGITCDPAGCIGKLADGRLLSYALAPEAFDEDCRRAAVVVATRDAPPDCAATVVGRRLWRERGALALRRDGMGFVVEGARPPNFDRPWAPAPRQRLRPSETAGADSAAAPAAARATPHDATPRPDDLEAGQ